MKIKLAHLSLEEFGYYQKWDFDLATAIAKSDEGKVWKQTKSEKYLLIAYNQGGGIKEKNKNSRLK